MVGVAAPMAAVNNNWCGLKTRKCLETSLVFFFFVQFWNRILDLQVFKSLSLRLTNMLEMMGSWLYIKFFRLKKNLKN